MAAFFHFPPSLAKKDFSLFHQLFSKEVEKLLPVRGTVFFWEQKGRWLSKDRAEEMIGTGLKKLPALCESLKPTVIRKTLILPVAVEDGDNVALLVEGMDPGLLRKMAPEWLLELREDIQRAFVQLKQPYVYPETGVYSSHILKLLRNEYTNKSGAFFLIGAPGRTRRPTRALSEVVKTGHLLESSLSGPVFYFGDKVFGAYLENISRESGLDIARRLLGRLKREGVHSLHIGIAIVREHEKRSLERLLDEGWQALETAEKRGPFSLCESSFLHNLLNSPLAPPPRNVAGKLQYKWRRMKRFSLLLVRDECPDRAGKNQNAPLGQLIGHSFKDKYISVPFNGSLCYVLLPEVSPKKAMAAAEEIKKVLDHALPSGQVAVGISYWPCQDFSRTASMKNCQKSLMHGDFFGKGSVTLFDHISLNVCGDYYFDEGDYRQAVREYRAGLQMNPGEINLLNSLGVALTELDKLTDAVHCFEMVLEKEPNNFMALVNNGFALRMLRREGEALSCLSEAEKCREFSGSAVSADILLQLGRLYSAKGEHKKAVRVLEKMRARNSEKTGHLMYSLLGGAYAACGKNKKAISMLQKAVQKNPHDAVSLSVLGDLYGMEGEGEEISLSLCTQAVNIDDLSWENWYRLAKARFTMKDYDGAQAAVRESLLRNRKAVDAIFLAGKIYEKRGNRKQARKKFKQVLRITPESQGASEALRELR